jgi:hypothetical protein
MLCAADSGQGLRHRAPGKAVGGRPEALKGMMCGQIQNNN